MVDIRFHPSAAPLLLSALLGARVTPHQLDDARALALFISGADELDVAGPSHIALAAHEGYRAALEATAAGAVVVHPKLGDAVPPGAVRIISDRPQDLFVDILEQIYPGAGRAAAAAQGNGGIDAPLLEEGVSFGTNVVVGPGVEIGRGTIIGPNTVIGAGVTIGRNCVVGPNVSIECAHIGSNVVLHAGARIGTEGFGWLEQGRGNRKIPQLGRVIIQDRVEIGANSTIDRGALGDTVIGEATKIDNLVQIGHNCRIGRYCLIAAQSGLSGSTVVEDGVLMGGGSGTGGHLTIGMGSVVYGRAGVSKSWPPGSRLFGAPARDVKEYWREAATLRRLSKGDKSGREK